VGDWWWPHKKGFTEAYERGSFSLSQDNQALSRGDGLKSEKWEGKTYEKGKEVGSDRGGGGISVQGYTHI